MYSKFCDAFRNELLVKIIYCESVNKYETVNGFAHALSNYE